MKPRARLLIWIGFTGAVLLVLWLKAHQLGWLQVKAPLELNGQPAVLVFVQYRYNCECEAFVNGNARAQVANWSAEARDNVPLYLFDIEQRADLARRYAVIRTPTMLLVNAHGEIVWRQDGVTQFTNDGLPLDLDGIKAQIAQLMENAKIEKPWQDACFWPFLPAPMTKLLAIAHIFALVDEIQAQVWLSFGPDGLSGHPDYIATGVWSAAAFRRAEMLPRSLAASLNMRPVHPVLDKSIALLVNVSAVWDVKLAAMRAHATQVGTSPMVSAPEEFQCLFLARAYFVRVASCPIAGDFTPEILKGYLQ